MDPVRKREDSGVYTVARADGAGLHQANSPSAATPVPAAPSSDRELYELVDVPAAVVCAICGNADCLGCYEERSRSGIVSIVAWERPGAGFVSRLWQTTRATSRDAAAFFEVLPDGPAGPALRFAVAAEVVAVSTLALLVGPLVVLVAPGLVQQLVQDPAACWAVLRGVLVGLPALSMLLVAAHVFHGLGIACGARMSGAPARVSRALRFGLYSTGWDLALGPFGFLATALDGGVRPAFGLIGLTSGMPTRATLGFLRGAYGLDGARARKALHVSYAAATVATVVSAALVIAAIAAAVM